LGRQAFVKAVFTLSTLLITTAVLAQPVPSEETAEEAKNRISAALKAQSPADFSKGIKVLVDRDGRFVVEVDGSGQTEPITSAVRAAHSAVIWRSTRKPAIKEWLVNINWDGISGPQLLFSGAWKTPIDKMTAEAWLAQKYNGSSEKGLIGLARWCRRGGAYQAPALCETVKSSAIDRMVWERSGQK
jgi:hypothetical protein